MLIRTGRYVQELFPKLSTESVPSRHPERRVENIESIRRASTEGTRDLSFGAPPFILCGLPIRRLPAGTLTYTRRNGRFYLEVVGHPQYGVPFG
jgi:hypothetical protein